MYTKARKNFKGSVIKTIAIQEDKKVDIKTEADSLFNAGQNITAEAVAKAKVLALKLPAQMAAIWAEIVQSILKTKNECSHNSNSLLEPLSIPLYIVNV